MKKPREGLLYDAQWVNIVNHENCYRDMDKDDAIALAVKLTEKAIQSNMDAESAEIARLAADQQKGGGEVVAQLYVSETSVDLCPIAPGKLSDGEIRRRYGTGTHDLFVRAEPRIDDDRLASMIEHGMSGVDWSPSPQPSIPAPAQQDGKASGGEEYYIQDTRQFVGNCPMWWTAGFSVDCKPTHWMPIPPLPDPQPDGQEG